VQARWLRGVWDPRERPPEAARYWIRLEVDEASRRHVPSRGGTSRGGGRARYVASSDRRRVFRDRRGGARRVALRCATFVWAADRLGSRNVWAGLVGVHSLRGGAGALRVVGSRAALRGLRGLRCYDLLRVIVHEQVRRVHTPRTRGHGIFFSGIRRVEIGGLRRHSSHGSAASTHRRQRSAAARPPRRQSRPK